MRNFNETFGKDVLSLPAFIIKKIKNRQLNYESLSELKNSETEISLKQFLKKPIYSGNNLWWKLTSPTPTNVEIISSHCRQFQLTISPRQTTIMAYIFHKLVAPFYNYF